MSDSCVYLFVDTNLLIQCRPLEELNWSAWDSFDEVRLIVSNPVLREIDYRKNKGNDRISKRARAASAMFRENLSDEYKLVRISNPTVKLSVEPQHQPSKALQDRLNYQERDDQLIGTIYEFIKLQPDIEVRLLTHDTTPIYTAKSLNIASDIIPDNWLLPPETTIVEKEFAALKKENIRLKNAEPSFTIRCLDGDDTEIECYKLSYTWFEALTDRQIDDLMQKLKDRFPLETEFGSREPVERKPRSSAIHLPGTKEKFVPATDEAIEKYRDEEYPEWWDQCEKMLRGYHHTLQQEAPIPSFTFMIENRGTRPAVDSLITIEAKGNFKTRPRATNNQDDDIVGQDGAQTERTTRLPYPPVAPTGKWRKTIGGSVHTTLSAFERLNRSLFNMPGFPARNHLGFDHSILPLQSLQKTTRDPNAFYYKPDRPLIPQCTFSLECALWRHGDGENSFHGEIYLPRDKKKVSGALVCRIQAGNLSETASKLIPVRISVSFTSAFDQADELVKALSERSEPSFKSS